MIKFKLILTVLFIAAAIACGKISSEDPGPKGGIQPQVKALKNALSLLFFPFIFSLFVSAFISATVIHSSC
jgi:hypothetical protein